MREELAVFLRNQNIITTAQRGVTTYTDSFTGNGAATDFNLSKPGLKNVRSVLVNGLPISYGSAYEVNYESQVVIITPAPGTVPVLIQYDAGVGDSIYPDLPRIDLDLTSYPRIGFDDISQANSEQALNAELLRTDTLISLVVYAATKEECLRLWQLCRDAIRANKKAFYHFCFITLAGAGPLGPSAGRHDKIVQKNQDFRIPFEHEVN